MKQVKQFLDYAASQEEEIITFNASGMVLAVHYDSSYLSKNNSLSRAGGRHLLSNDKLKTPSNGSILNLSTTIRNVMSSAAEAEPG